jgi:hypothetical protein
VTIDSHVPWRGDADADSSTLDRRHRDSDVSVDHNLFANASGQYEHGLPSLKSGGRRWSVNGAAAELPRGM